MVDGPAEVYHTARQGFGYIFSMLLPRPAAALACISRIPTKGWMSASFVVAPVRLQPSPDHRWRQYQLLSTAGNVSIKVLSFVLNTVIIRYSFPALEGVQLCTALSQCALNPTFPP